MDLDKIRFQMKRYPPDSTPVPFGTPALLDSLFLGPAELFIDGKSMGQVTVTEFTLDPPKHTD
jgi:hypothetical protein